GYGGAVATVDATATAVALDVLRRGGNAVDAAVAAAATLGVTEPFSAGIGGGGFLLHYDGRTGRVSTIDGRETAPASMRRDSFVDPVTGQPYAFPEARVSGLSVGVPGTPATWREALRRWGSRPLATLLRPAAEVAERGFVVDATFHAQAADNAAVFAQFAPTARLYLPGGQPPAVGSVLRNPDLAATYRQLARHGVDAFYRGPIARDIAATVQRPPRAPDPGAPWAHPIRPGGLTVADLAGYRVRTPAPTRSDFRGLAVYGMPAPSSGGIAVGEALNILERFDLAGADRATVLHHYLEASALAFADRNRYVGDGTPRSLSRELLRDRYAARRACLVRPDRALAKPVAPGVPGDRTRPCAVAGAGGSPVQGHSTTNLTVADRWGSVVEYTLTLEQTGGNGMVVPGRGFLLNNELTDFNFVPTQGDAPDPNLPAPGKRPRSSISPTIVLRDGRPFLALGTPGGSTIITTVLQILVHRLLLGESLPAALAAPRASQRNTAAVTAEPAFLAGPDAAALAALGHGFTATPEIGAATAIEFGPGGRLLAVAEPTRRGGGAAAVLRPRGYP
ncbi:MAG TPA: gamma-glutamyltransferase, partial [Pilimelia sp.]|nr:gamma-glutamyltransferase [Pilimelia sp.]